MIKMNLPHIYIGGGNPVNKLRDCVNINTAPLLFLLFALTKAPLPLSLHKGRPDKSTGRQHGNHQYSTLIVLFICIDQVVYAFKFT